MIESEFNALLVSINKLLSTEQVQQLAFITMGDVKNRRLSEECERSGNALPLFQAMKDRDLYTHTEPTLLLKHLKSIDRHDAVMMLEQEMGVHLQNRHDRDNLAHQHMLSSTYQASGTGSLASETFERASVSNYSASSFGNQGQQTMPPVMDMSSTCIAQMNGVCKDGASSCDHDNKPPTLSQGQTGSRKLEPEASLHGDATSPRNFPDIPDSSSRDISAAATRFSFQGAVNQKAIPYPLQEPIMDRTISSATASSCNGSEIMQIGTLVSAENCQDIPGQHPGGGSGKTIGSSATDYISQAPDRTPVIVTPSGSSGHPPEIPPRPPRGINKNINHMNVPVHFPIQESQEIVPGAHPHQTASRPDHVNYRGHQFQGQGNGRSYPPRMEVEQLQGRPPPVPERPVQRVEKAEFGVEELELCHLSRHFSAGDVALFGLELGFSSGKISQLNYDNPHDISKVFYRLMVEWKSAQHGDSNMRENLMNHLRKINCMGLADDLKKGRFKRR